MGAQTTLAIASHDFAARLLAQPETDARARLTAECVAQFLPGSGVVVYLHDEEGWVLRATAGDVAFQPDANAGDALTLTTLVENKRAVLVSGSELSREQYAHLNVRRTVVSLACLPLQIGERAIGAIEWLTFDQPLSPEIIAAITPLVELAAMALGAALTAEKERNSNLQSISRLAQLYDIEKVFNSTLDLKEIQPVITSKLQEVLDVDAVNLWLIAEDEKLKLVSQSGLDDTVEEGELLPPNAGIVNVVAEEGIPLLAAENDDAVQQRDVGRGNIRSMMAAPLLSDGALVGVVEAINKRDGTEFDDDDLFFLSNLCEAAAGALNNANRFYAERKLEILQTLVHVSREITSTLDVERVLQTVVNGPASIIPYERAVIAQERRGKLQIGAISGEHQVNPGDANVKRLADLLQWTADLEEELYVRQVADDVEHPSDSTRGRFRRYFEESHMRAFLCVPLSDEEGRVGMLSLESSDPDFLSPAHREIIHVLASQATVALRNAQLYAEVPFIGVLETVIQKKKKLLALPRHRRALLASLAVATLVILVVVPIPMRVAGNAIVGPVRHALVQPDIEGTVSQVHVREGQFVRQGDIVADLNDWNYRQGLAGAQAKYDTALANMSRALASADGSEAGIQRVQAEFWKSELERARERLDHAHLRSPIDGWVTTPYVENFVGRHLAAGDSFLEIQDSSRATVDVAVSEFEIPLLRSGTSAAVKLNGFPARVFRGNVTILSPKSTAEGQDRVFHARVDVPNPDAAMRPGMQGQGKLSVGWRPVGYVIFRNPALWAYQKLWSWFGW